MNLTRGNPWASRFFKIVSVRICEGNNILWFERIIEQILWLYPVFPALGKRGRRGGGKKREKVWKKVLTKGKGRGNIMKLSARTASESGPNGDRKRTLKSEQYYDELVQRTLEMIWVLRQTVMKDVSVWKRARWNAKEEIIERKLIIPLFREFDPGSGRTLAARLTHASRTEFWKLAFKT